MCKINFIFFDKNPRNQKMDQMVPKLIISNIFTCDFISNIIKPSNDYMILRKVEGWHIILQPFEGLHFLSLEGLKDDT